MKLTIKKKHLTKWDKFLNDVHLTSFASLGRSKLQELIAPHIEQFQKDTRAVFKEFGEENKDGMIKKFKKGKEDEANEVLDELNETEVEIDVSSYKSWMKPLKKELQPDTFDKEVTGDKALGYMQIVEQFEKGE